MTQPEAALTQVKATLNAPRTNSPLAFGWFMFDEVEVIVQAYEKLLGELAHHRETLRQIMAWEGPSAFKHLCVPVAEANCQWCTAMADEYVHQDDFYERHA